ncbi:hypothetical protein [Croceimicrobium hydrocarbonivorans]|uniref:Uncharacterized protein n=1 Tax=Croceimicrobium hydrocarbonivorans TaxID=2761580 RepID=A0A7H0VD39_9FLAO|nr:hypothetical protein [Croceimicrobium hydrocarbonivorans]QNR23637.1 hypothetical protein H4K34_14820 [Croceimicrobium hydrocarbonivorans]
MKFIHVEILTKDKLQKDVFLPLSAIGSIILTEDNIDITFDSAHLPNDYHYISVPVSTKTDLMEKAKQGVLDGYLDL